VARGPLDVKRELDELVPEYRPREATPRAQRYLGLLVKFAAGAVLAALAVAAIVYILHKHLTQAQTAPAPKRPVPVHIVPAQK
jgi:hypothetical protein